MVNPAPLVRGARFVSKMDEVVEIGQRTATAKQWAAYLRNKGIKQQELTDTGIVDILEALGDQKLAKEDLKRIIASRRPQLDMKVGKTHRGSFPGELDYNDRYEETILSVRTSYLENIQPRDEANFPLDAVELVSRGADGRYFTYKVREPFETAIHSEGFNPIEFGRNAGSSVTPVGKDTAIIGYRMERTPSMAETLTHHRELREGGDFPLGWSVTKYNPDFRIFTQLEVQRDIQQLPGSILREVPESLARDIGDVVALNEKQLRDLPVNLETVNKLREASNLLQRTRIEFDDVIGFSFEDFKANLLAGLPTETGPQDPKLIHRVMKSMTDRGIARVETKIADLERSVGDLSEDDWVKFMSTDVAYDLKINKIILAKLKRLAATKTADEWKDQYTKFEKLTFRVEDAWRAKALEFNDSVMPLSTGLGEAFKKAKLTGTGSQRTYASQYGKVEYLDRIPADRVWQLILFKTDLEKAIDRGATRFRWSTAEKVLKRWPGKKEKGAIQQYDVDYPRMIKSYLKSEYGVDVDIVKTNGYWEFKISDEIREGVISKPAYLYAVPPVAGTAVEKSSEEKQPKKLEPGIYEDTDTGKYFKIDKDGNMTEYNQDETP